MSIRQDSEISCEQLRSTLQNINNRLSNLQQCIPNQHNWKDKLTKETNVPRLNLHKISIHQRENNIPLKKVTATFGEKKQEKKENIDEIKIEENIKKSSQTVILQQTPQKLRSQSVNGSQQVLKQQINHSIQFKVSNASRLQNQMDYQFYQSLNCSHEKPLKASIIGNQQLQTNNIDQSIEYIQPTLLQKPMNMENLQQNNQTRNNSLLSTPVKHIAHASQGQTPLRRGNSSTQQKFQQSQQNSYQCFTIQTQQQFQNQDLIKILQNHVQVQPQQSHQYNQQNQVQQQQNFHNMTQFRVPHQRQSSQIRMVQGQAIFGNSMMRN